MSSRYQNSAKMLIKVNAESNSDKMLLSIIQQKQTASEVMKENADID